MKVSQNLGSFYSQDPGFESLAPLKEQNTQMGHIAATAFPAGLGLGLHPQPVPHHVSVTCWRQHRASSRPMSSLTSLRLAQHMHLPLMHATGLHTVRRPTTSTALLAAFSRAGAHPVGPKPGVTRMTELPAPGPNPFPWWLLEPTLPGERGPCVGGGQGRTWGV